MLALLFKDLPNALSRETCHQIKRGGSERGKGRRERGEGGEERGEGRRGGKTRKTRPRHGPSTEKTVASDQT